MATQRGVTPRDEPVARDDSPVATPSKTALTVTIPAGQSVSNSANLTTVNLMALLSPVDWTPANVSFLVADVDQAANYRDLWDTEGREVVKSMGPNRSVLADPGLTAGAMFIKIRSGPSGNPVQQEADRVFTLIVQ